MIELPSEIIVGVSLGLVAGAGPVITVGFLGAVGSYLGRPLSRVDCVAVVLSLSLANGYAVWLFAPGIRAASVTVPQLVVAVVVVAVLATYANSQAKRVVSELPIGTSLPVVRKATVADETLEASDVDGQLTIRSSGIRPISGYPKLPPSLQTALETDVWRLPADLALSSLECRLETRLRTKYDLAAVSVSIDGGARASIAAAPPRSGVAERIPEGWRAVTIRATIPAGLGSDEEIVIYADDEPVCGLVLDVAGSDTSESDPTAPIGPIARPPSTRNAGSGGDSSGQTHRTRAVAVGEWTTSTVAVPAPDAEVVMSAVRRRVVVPAVETNETFEALSLLERADRSVRKLPAGDLATALDSNVVDVEYGDVHVLVADASTVGGDERERDGRWIVEPDVTALEAGGDVFVVADPVVLKRLGPDTASSPDPSSAIESSTPQPGVNR
ncbi:hypothetical protein [Natrarchaeobius oligotrophus]|uniref:Potassium transporter TrkA n=1 Tax=Natrarchaeobius chitinivorans TaxID=1679083 RepID=A0A3N6MEN3_NATCH|nr:hypothetical protein [Natrarchaeobius chitinivorans]RQH01298.1 hypothetical protein EA472_07545 [Natrarchaeobius chitinivorans]